jgi:heptosyltransferase-2
MAATQIPFSTTEHALRLPEQTLAAIAERFKSSPRPWIVLGIGASHPQKDWPDDYWTEFLCGLRRRTAGTVFLIGGRQNEERAQDFIAHGAGISAVNACDLGLTEAAALLHHADLFIGPSSGPVNLAAATATAAFELAGTTPPLTYSKFFRTIAPEGGFSPGGMRLISPARVLDQVAPCLMPETAGS